MLGWHHDRRATAQQMLEHPWLNMPANYDYKYTEKEYQILQLKKDMKANDQELTNNNYKLEMNELIESEPEEYKPDSPDTRNLDKVFADSDGSLQSSTERAA